MSAFARFRQRKTAIPRCIRITGGKPHDVNLLDHRVLNPGAFHIMDRDTACFTANKVKCLKFKRRPYVKKNRGKIILCLKQN